MVATISSPTLAATHGSLKRSISDYTAGQLSKQDILQLLAQALETDPDCASDIREYLDRELRGRRLSSADHQELTAGFKAAPSENIPTETKEGIPENSGFYRVDGEGTLILSSDFEPEPPPPLSVQAPSLAAATDQQVKKSEPEEKPNKPAGLQVGSILRDRFRLDEEVASGSMGLVYRATDLLKLDSGAMSPVVAVKVINPKFANDRAALKSFQNEVANTQHLSHPNIINLFELDKHGDHFFMTMEWLEGESLDTLLDRSMGSALPPIQAYAIIEQLCDALAYAHARNVVHADIKPGNVFLTKPGELKLIDFGIAHFDDVASISDAPDAKHQTVALTPAYASCEALEKQKPTPQDDLFSLACLVYRLLSGRRAFGSMTALRAEEQCVELVPIGGITKSRWHALAKALSFRRKDRHSDVNAFAEEFGQRATPRQSDTEPAVDDAVFTETMTLQALPQGVGVPGGETAELGSTSSASVATEATATVESDADLEIDGALTADMATSNALPDNSSQLVQTETVSEDILIDDALIESASGSFDVMEPEAEADDFVFTETAPLGKPPENLEATTSDTVNLEETAPLGAVSFQQGVDLLGTDVIGETSGTIPDIAASNDTEDLGDLPEPINFFDAECDESVFVPLENAQEPATNNEAALPADSSSMIGGAAEVSPAVATNTAPAQTPASAEPARQPLAAAPVKPATPAPQAEQNSVDNAAHHATTKIVKALTGAEQLPQTARRLSLGSLVTFVQAKPLQAGGAMAAIVAVIAIGAGWLFTADDSAAVIGTDQFAEIAATNTNEQAQPGTPKSQVVAPTELFFSSKTKTESELAGTPVKAADSGIATGNAVVAVPLSLANQSMSGSLPDVVESNLAAGSFAPVASPSPDNGPVTAGYMIALHNLARQALVAGDLTEPADASAMAWVDKMRAGEPNSKETLAVQAQLAAALLQRAEQDLVGKDIASAQRFAGLARKYAADDSRLAQLERSIEQMRIKLDRQTTAAASAEAEVAQEAAAAAEVNDLSVEIPVALSDIEFTRYAEPVFPAQLLNAPVTGWVDVAFTIGVDGETRNIKVTGSDLPADFVQPSLTAVGSWSFRPYVHRGEVVPVHSAVRLNYTN